MSLRALSLATLLSVFSVFAADAPPEAPPHPPEPTPKVEDTPEAAVRRMLHAMSVGDKQGLADSILPFPQQEKLLEPLKPMSPIDQKETEDLLAKPFRILKAGDVITLPGRQDEKSYQVPSEAVGPDKALVQIMDDLPPLQVLRTEHGWRVDYMSWIGSALSLSEPSFEETSRVTAPSGKLDAVVIESNGGATTSFGYHIHIVEKGKSTARDGRAALVYGGAGVNLRWEKDRVIAEYLECRWTEQKEKTVTVAGEKVEVELRPGVKIQTEDKPRQP